MEDKVKKWKALETLNTNDIYINPFDDVNTKLDEEIKLIKDLSKDLDKDNGLIYTTLNKQGKSLHAHIDDTRSNLAQINIRISNQIEIMKEIVSFQQSISNNLYILASAVGDIREHMKLPWYKRWFKKLK